MKFSQDTLETLETNLLELFELDGEYYVLAYVEQYLDTNILRCTIRKINGKCEYISVFDKLIYEVADDASEVREVEAPECMVVNLRDVSYWKPGYGVRLHEEYINAR